MAFDVGLDVRLGPDHQVPVALDLAGEVAEHVARALQDELARERVVTREHGRLRLDDIRVGVAVRAVSANGVHRDVCHVQPPLAAPFPHVGRLPPNGSIAGAGIFARAPDGFRGNR